MGEVGLVKGDHLVRPSTKIFALCNGLQVRYFFLLYCWPTFGLEAVKSGWVGTFSPRSRPTNVLFFFSLHVGVGKYVA